MTFAHALARIEVMLKDSDAQYSIGMAHLLCTHAHDIVQLARVAEEMRRETELYQSPIWPSVTGIRLKNETYGAPAFVRAAQAYDQLMKQGGEE